MKILGVERLNHAASWSNLGLKNPSMDGSATKWTSMYCFKALREIPKEKTFPMLEMSALAWVRGFLLNTCELVFLAIAECRYALLKLGML